MILGLCFTGGVKVERVEGTYDAGVAFVNKEREWLERQAWALEVFSTIFLFGKLEFF